MTELAPRVSIVTPSYNMADRLARCLDSVAGQDHGDVEHIVIDGGSTDGTVDLLRSRPSIQWISEPDGGQTDALAKGFGMATGALMGWLNADDVLLPGAIRQVVDVYLRNETVGLVCGGMESVSGSASWIDEAPVDLTFASLCARNVINQPSTYFTSEAFAAAGGLDLSFDLTMDYDLWLRILKAGYRVARVDAVLSRFEIHPESKTGSGIGRRFAAEEARALLKHGEIEAATRTLGRWVRDLGVAEVVTLLREGRDAEARLAAARALSTIDPALSRSRAALWVTARSPRIGARLLRWRRTPDR